jgi:hypothetical protein
MTIRTAEEFSSFLDGEIVWRKKELALLKSINSTYPIKSYQDTMVRSGIALLYAHWEGFIKNAACTYLEFISKHRLPYEQLTSNFIAIKIREIVNDIPSFTKFSKRKEIVDFVQTGLNEYCFLPSDTINTQSNLSSLIFKEIMATLGLDYTPYQSKEKLIDEKLVHNRNNIAHGRFLTMDLQDYDLLEKDIIELMDIFKDQISNAATSKSYLRSLPS